MTGSRGVRGCAKFQSQHVNRTQTAAWINKEIIRSLPKARRTKKDFTTDLASSFDGEGWMYSCYFFHCICYVLFVFRTAIDHAEVAVALIVRLWTRELSICAIKCARKTASLRARLAQASPSYRVYSTAMNTTNYCMSLRGRGLVHEVRLARL